MSDGASRRPASRTLGDLVDEMATGTPGAEALVFRDERLDYAGLKARVDEFARAFLAVGIRRGDRVALLVTNRTEWIVAAFGAAKIGAVVAALSTFSTPRELAWALEHSGAAALITLKAFRGRRFLARCATFAPNSTGHRRARSGARGCRTCAPSWLWRGAHPPRSSRCRNSWHGAPQSMPQHSPPHSRL